MQDETEYGISFVSLPGMAAIEVIDPIERHRYRLETPADVGPAEIDTDSFLFPVDRAVVVETDAISLPSVVGSYVRTREGQLVAEVEDSTAVSLPVGEYVVELCTPIKLYLEFEGAIDITSDLESMHFEFEQPLEVAIGARSAHQQPETTVSTTPDPVNMMRVVESFGSALKTTSPERSFPTLRGHPPRVEVGGTLDVPDELSPPNTGISLTLEPDIEPVFTASPLAYYLGAEVNPGDRNTLRVDGEVVKELGTGDHFTDAIEETLRHTFLLDCIVRTEGLYPVDLNERTRVTERVQIDPGELYDSSIGERLRRYLSIPPSHIDDIGPRWGIAAHMIPDPKHFEMLPYVVDDLGLIRVHEPNSLEYPSGPTDIVDTAPQPADTLTRSTGTTTAPSSNFVRPPPSDCFDQVWIGDGTPIGASKAIPDAFEHRLDKTPTASDIDITVVCNDRRMNQERGLIDEIYGSRDDVDFSVNLHQELTREELLEVLSTRTDFLHYVGHIDDDGFECMDGKLDLEAVDDVEVSAFLLNACQSYHQGKHLIEGGAIGGIVTLSDVINEGAVRIGGTIAQCLNQGFPLHSALDIGRRDSLMAGRYIVIGDGRVAMTQPKSIPHLNEVTTEPLEFSYTTFPTKQRDMGSMTMPRIGDSQQYVLISNENESVDPTVDELMDFFSIETMPVHLDGELTWSNEIESL